MNLNFLKKLNKIEPEFKKPIREEGLRPMYIWNVLLITYLCIGVTAFALVLLSYNFLTKDREGVIDQSLNSAPQLNTQKVENIKKFFEEKENIKADLYKKLIIDPSKN